MYMFARFDENPAMTLQDIKKKKNVTDGRMHGRTHTHTHMDNVKTVYPPQTKFAGGIISSYCIKTAKYATNSHIHKKRYVY